MSRDYGYYCEACNATITLDNLGEHSAAEILDYLPQVHSLAEFNRDFPGYINLTPLCWGVSEGQFRDLLEFILLHSGHKLTIIDEYQEFILNKQKRENLL